MTKGLKFDTFLFSENPSWISVNEWQGKSRMEFSIGMPFEMSATINLSESQTIELISQLQSALKDIQIHRFHPTNFRVNHLCKNKPKQPKRQSSKF